jgi:hypothetical protein
LAGGVLPIGDADDTATKEVFEISSLAIRKGT